MTEQQKQRISDLRASGLSYAAISAEIGVSSNLIKSYCQRNDLGGIRSSVGRGVTHRDGPFVLTRFDVRVIIMWRWFYERSKEKKRKRNIPCNAAWDKQAADIH